MTEKPVPKWDDQFELKLAAAIGWLRDDDHVPSMGLENVLDRENIVANKSFITGKKSTIGYNARLLGKLLTLKEYMEVKNEKRESPDSKSAGHKLLDEVLEDYTAMLKDAFSKMPSEQRKKAIEQFGAFAREDSAIVLKSVLIEQAEQKKNESSDTEIRGLGLDTVEVMSFVKRLEKLTAAPPETQVPSGTYGFKAPAIEALIDPVDTAITADKPRGNVMLSGQEYIHERWGR